MSTADSGRLQGQHSARLLVIIDETPAIDPDFWPSIEGTLSSGDSRLLILGNPTVVGGPFYDAFGRNRSSWTTFSISAFDTPNLAGLTVDSLLALPDAELDDNPYPFLTTRRWVRQRHGEWFNGGIENSPLWASRVLGEFPTESTNALFPLSALEAARRPAVDPGRDVVVGVDVAGPGKDRTVAIAVPSSMSAPGPSRMRADRSWNSAGGGHRVCAWSTSIRSGLDFTWSPMCAIRGFGL
jgi:hypothetical protein